MRHEWFILILILIILAIYTCLKIDVLLPQRFFMAVICTVLLFSIFLGWQWSFRGHVDLTDSFFFSTVAWLGAILSGVWATFILLSIVTDIGSFIWMGVFKMTRGTGLTGFDLRTLIHLETLIVLGLSILFTGMGSLTALSSPLVKEIMVPIQNLPKSLEALKVVQISDLHVDPIFHFKRVTKIVETVLKLKPDMIVITGDMVDGTPDRLAKNIEPLSKLKAPLGVYFVTGNHEYYWGAQQWVHAVSDMGFIPLINENRQVGFHDATVLIAGIPDDIGVRFIPSHSVDYQKAVKTNAIPDLKILLAHRPDQYVKAEQAGFDVQLSGHTHGGQFFPFNWIVRLAHHPIKGLFHGKHLWLYVNPGTGFWGPLDRFMVPSEITVIRFVSE